MHIHRKSSGDVLTHDGVQWCSRDTWTPKPRINPLHRECLYFHGFSWWLRFPAFEYRPFQQCIKEKECWNIKARFGYSGEETHLILPAFVDSLLLVVLCSPWEDKRIEPLNVPFTHFTVHFIHLMLLAWVLRVRHALLIPGQRLKLGLNV